MRGEGVQSFEFVKPFAGNLCATDALKILTIF